MSASLCPLCEGPGGLPVWADADWRVVRVIDDPAYPAFYRVIAQAHVAEFSQLDAARRRRCMDLVNAIERTLIEHLQPTKINLATLGNVVPHLHWHVVARFEWDRHFPQPIWGQPQREVSPPPAERLPLTLPALDAHVCDALTAL